MLWFDFKSSHNKNDYTCVMDSTLTITRPRELPSRITSHFVIQFWKVFNVHVNDNLYVFRTCLITINTLAYLIYLTRFFFNFKWKYIRKFDFVFVIIIYYCMVITISILKRILRTLCCFLFLSLYCMFTVISNDNLDKTKTSAPVTDSRVQMADIYFKYEIC